MSELPGKAVSLWMETTPETDYPQLLPGLEVDVAVIGGGIAGLTTAALLKEAGKKVAVIEASRIGSGVTGHTTGKVTSLHQITYGPLAKSFGQDGARTYGQANEAAIVEIERLIKKHNIKCDFTRHDNYTYAINDKDLEKVMREAEIAQEIGLPAEFTSEVPLPIPTKGAVKFKNQASFHSRRFLIGLAAAVWGKGSYVFEQTRAMDVDDDELWCTVKTDQGDIKATDVVVATNVPFLDRGFFFARAHPHRSYLVACRIDGQLPQGSFISAGSNPTGSILPMRLPEGEFLMVGGEGHKTGQGGTIAERYRNLADYARGYFPVLSVDYRWATQDGVSVDGVPYIGKINRFANHVYVITGLKKWGLTNGPVGAMIIRDLLTEKENPWAKLFDSTRIKPLAGGKKFLTENVDSGLKFVLQRLKKGGSLSDLVEGEGKVIRSGGKQIAAYKDDDGNVHSVSAVCTHLQCIVEFNDAEKTWDCPCHGSRFDIEGKVIQGPAVKNLKKESIK